jgi:hypothetical protein
MTSSAFTAKASSYTPEQAQAAIRDCHDTLRIGRYEYTDPYAQKLWAEIDAMRPKAAQAV